MNERTDVTETHDPQFDKTHWRAGQGEPDRVEWYYCGVPCLAKREPLGNWCGYVAVADPMHPWRSIKMSELAEQAEVHGGVTYAEPCNHDAGICHVPKPGEPDDVFWVGFDCGHAWDFMPGMDAQLRASSIRAEDRPFLLQSQVVAMPYPPPADVYRDQSYVMREIERLAEQLLAAAEGKGADG